MNVISLEMCGASPGPGTTTGTKNKIYRDEKKNFTGFKKGFTDINEKFAMRFPEFDVVVSLTEIVSRWSLSCCINQFIIFIVISCNAGTKTHKSYSIIGMCSSSKLIF